MSLRHALLGLLSGEPASGYDLLKIFNVSLANVWPATQSQVYAELGRLAEAGLVEVVAEGPRGRKEYAIAESGRAELRHWLTEVAPVRTGRSETLLRVFFLGQVEPEQARAYLRRLAETAEQSGRDLAALSDAVSAEEDDLAFYGRLALEWGLRFSAMQREWADWAERRIEERGAALQAAGPPGASGAPGRPEGR